MLQDGSKKKKKKKKNLSGVVEIKMKIKFEDGGDLLPRSTRF